MSSAATASRPPKLPSTPTRSGRKAGSNTTPKLNQSSQQGKGTTSTPKTATKGVSDSAKRTTSSPKLPPRPKPGEKPADKAKEASTKAQDTTDKATEDTKAKAEESAEETGPKINLQDNDPAEEGDDDENPQGKVSQIGNETEESTGELESADPEPIEEEDDTDTVSGAKETTLDTGDDDDDAGQEAGDEAGDETEDTADNQSGGGVTGGLTKGAKGLTGRASGAKDTVTNLGSKTSQGDVQGATKDTASDVQDGVQDTANDAQDTAGDVAEGAQDAAGKAKDTAEDVADGAQDTAGDAVEGAQDAAEKTKDTAEDTADGAKDTVEDTLDTAKDAGPDQAGDAVDSAKGAVKDTADGVKDTAEDTADTAKDTAKDTADGAKDNVGDTADGAKDTVDDTIDTAKDAGPDQAGDAVDSAKDTAEDAVNKAEDTAEDATDELPVDLSILKGLEVGEGGKIFDKEGNPVGEVTEGNPEDLLGHEVGDNGEILDEDGDLVGRVDVLSDDAKKAAGEAKDAVDEAENEVETYLPDLDILKGLEVTESGEIFDKDGNVVGRITEGDPEQLAGQVLNEEGEVLDEDGDAIGRAETIAQPVKDAADEAQDDLPDVSALDGLKVGDGGKIFDNDGKEVGKLTDGDAKDLAGQTLNDKGEILDEDGDIIGRAEALPQDAQDATEGVADEAKRDVPDISALEGLEVGEDGNIIGPDGNILGKITEGDPNDLVGQKLNAEGEILDDDGDAIGRAEIVPQEAQDIAEGLKPDLSIIEGKKINKKGKILDEEGEVIAQLTEDSDLKQCAGKIPNEKGEILNDKGDVVGHVEIVPGEAADEVMKQLHPELLEETKDAAEGAKDAAQEAAQEVKPDFSIVEGLKVNKNGEVLDEDGEPIARLAEGELSDVKGKKLNDQGEILDSDGNVIGKVELIQGDANNEAEDDDDQAEEEPEEEPEEEAGSNLPPVSILEGLKVNKAGYIVDSSGNPIGRLVEGDPKKLSKLGVESDAEGQFWDNKGKIIGRAETLPEDDGDGEDAPFAGLEGLIVVKDGWVEDENGNRVGQLIDGDKKKLVGRHVDEDGDVIDKRGNVVGHAERYEEPEEEEPEKADLSILNGLTLNKQGNVIGNEGVPIARLVEGNAKELAGRKVDGEGQIWNDSGKAVGRVELIPENEREAKPDGPFAGLEGLVVVRDGWVEDEDGNRVGQIVDGDPKKLVGRAVDEDGDIIDKYGNVKGHAEPYEEPEEEEEDLSALAGGVVNKTGNVVDANGNVIGRITSGDAKKLAGRKVDGQGQIWSDDGKVIGQAELIPGGERDTTEGPFTGFEGLVVGKDGIVQDASGRIVGRITEGDHKKLQGRKVDEDGEILDKSGNSIGKAERWEPEEKQRDVSPMAGRKVNKEGEVRDADGNLIGRLTSGNLQSLVGKEIDDNGYVVDNDGNKIGECTLLENIQEEEEEEPEGPTQEELDEQQKKEQDALIAKKMIYILKETLDKVEPICKQITDHIEKADRTPKDELDEEQLVQNVKPLLEEGGKILQECNGSIRGLDPDGSIAANAKQRAAAGEATKEEHQLAELLKELTSTVVKTIDNGKKRIADMPHAKKKLNPLWGLLSEPLFQIIAAVGLLLAGVLGLVGRLLNGLGLGGLVNGLLGGLGIDKLLGGLGLGSLTEAIGLGGGKKKK